MFEDLLNCEFEYGAKGPDQYDCFTLAKEVLRRAGIGIKDWPSIVDVATRHDAIQFGKSDYTRLDQPEAFSVVTFKLVPGRVTHMGVVLPDCKTFIHIMQKRRVAIERLDYWRHKIDGFYRFNPGQ